MTERPMPRPTTPDPALPSEAGRVPSDRHYRREEFWFLFNRHCVGFMALLMLLAGHELAGVIAFCFWRYEVRRFDGPES